MRAPRRKVETMVTGPNFERMAASVALIEPGKQPPLVEAEAADAGEDDGACGEQPGGDEQRHPGERARS